jgi:hypothetical protein
LTRSTGDTNAGDGSDVSKTWVDANITLTPPSATNPVGASHTVTCTIKVNAGTGFAAAPDGTVCNISITAGPNVGTTGSCTTTGGSCQFTYTDTGGAGTDTIHATTTVTVGGVTLTRSTGDSHVGDGSDVTKTFTPPTSPALTPGFWKNHQAATTALLPITLGGYTVGTFAQAVAVFDAMKCSAPIDCLAGHLLAAKLDLASGSSKSISSVVTQADALLSLLNYAGPGNYTPPTAAQKTLALQLEVLLDNYTNA